MHNVKIGFIGAGNMAGAIIGGIIRGGLFAPEEIGVFDVSQAALDSFSERGHKAFSSAAELAEACATIVLSIKPQNFSEVLPQLKPAMNPEKVIVSIAAGITAPYMKGILGQETKIVLAMPNTPLLLGFGATALCRVDPTTQEEFEFVKSLFALSGIAEEISADKMCEIIPVNGSAPAFIYLLAKLIADNAEKAGIERKTAERLFCQTLIGSATMMMESGKSQQELIDMVCSPGGTTLAAMSALVSGGFTQSVDACFDACVKRAKELSAGK